jgi:hypothetical protein
MSRHLGGVLFLSDFRAVKLTIKTYPQS